MITSDDLPRYAPILGTDLSNAQPDVDYDALARQCRFAFVKLTEGGANRAGKVFVSPRAHEHVRGCEEAGVEVLGAYHFSTPDRGSIRTDPENEADAYLEKLDLYGLNYPAEGVSIPWLDYEDRQPDGRDTEWVDRWCVKVAEELDLDRVGLYIGKIARRGHVDLAALSVPVVLWSPLYPAPYGAPVESFLDAAIERGEVGPRVPGWQIWQLSSSWRPAWAGGDRCDLNIAKDLGAFTWERST